jgi:hypothetical protein
MKIYVTFRTDDDAPEDAPTKMANPSLTKLKLMMKGEMSPEGEKLKKPIDMAGAEFTVVLYDFKPNVANVCQAIVDVAEIIATSATYYRVNDHGQLREVK